MFLRYDRAFHSMPVAERSAWKTWWAARTPIEKPRCIGHWAGPASKDDRAQHQHGKVRTFTRADAAAQPEPAHRHRPANRQFEREGASRSAPHRGAGGLIAVFPAFHQPGDDGECDRPGRRRGRLRARERAAADPPWRPAMRTCLHCGEQFRSLHSGNRICNGCSGVVAALRSAIG